MLYEDKWHSQVVDYKDATGLALRQIDGLALRTVFIHSSLASWKSKKQEARSKMWSSDQVQKAKYWAMALTTWELVWLKHLVKELWFEEVGQMNCDNQATLHIASNQIFYEGPNTLRLIFALSEKISFLEL